MLDGICMDGKLILHTLITLQDDWPMYSGKPEDYEMGEPIGEYRHDRQRMTSRRLMHTPRSFAIPGFGATSTVRLATYKPLNQVVAVKVMDFEGSSSIRMMQREVELMSLSKHPNVGLLFTASVPNKLRSVSLSELSSTIRSFVSEETGSLKADYVSPRDLSLPALF